MKKLTMALFLCLASFLSYGEKIRLVIDAAHGGSEDKGATFFNGQTESNVCLQFAKALQEYAQKNNIEVVMVRSADESVPKDKRNTYKAEAGVKSYYISFDMMIEKTKQMRGARIMYSADSKDVAVSQPLAEKLKDGFNRINNVGTLVSDRCKASYIRDSEIPALIVQPGYSSNEQDQKKLIDSGIQQEVAMLIVKAITE